jgi:hypothetical protein
VSDISDDDQLIRYAARAQLGVLGRRRVSAKSVAEAMNVAPPNLSSWLQGRQPLGREMIRRIDGAVVALEPGLIRTGGLVGLAARLKGREGPDSGSVSASIPPTWTAELLREPHFHGGSVGVLMQASALLSTFLAAGGEAAKREVRVRYRDDLQRVVNQLILFGAGPPTPQSVEALVLLGSIACHAFDDVIQGSLETALRQTPFGFRVWRGITSTVHAIRDSKGRVPARDIKEWVRTQLRDCRELREISLYPARSLDLELAIAVPPDWSPVDDDWAGEVLRDRAEMSGPEGATVRERATAALGLWERALERDDKPARIAAERHLCRLAAQFREEAESPETVAPTGLRWTADTLVHAIDSDQKVCNTWPDSAEPCLSAVLEVAAGLDVPEDIRQDTRFLFEQALLQNAGVYRRRAIDTLRAGGWGAEIAIGLRGVLRHPGAEPWFRCRALFALGFLQERDNGIENTLCEAYEQARAQLRPTEPSRDLISETHAALFALGDCFGVLEAEQAANRVRDRIDHSMHGLVSACTDPRAFRIPRAATYLLAVTARPQDRSTLDSLDSHPDPVTQRVARWALDVRFDEDGNVRPIHASGHGGRMPGYRNRTRRS